MIFLAKKIITVVLFLLLLASFFILGFYAHKLFFRHQVKEVLTHLKHVERLYFLSKKAKKQGLTDQELGEFVFKQGIYDHKLEAE